MRIEPPADASDLEREIFARCMGLAHEAAAQASGMSFHPETIAEKSAQTVADLKKAKHLSNAARMGRLEASSPEKIRQAAKAIAAGLADLADNLERLIAARGVHLAGRSLRSQYQEERRKTDTTGISSESRARERFLRG